jgi:hypothetical protein
MWETSNSSSSSSSVETGTSWRSLAAEHSLRSLTLNNWCGQIVYGNFNLQLCFPICSSKIKGPSCRSRTFRFGCPPRERLFVTSATLSPRTKSKAIDGFERACISSLCICNTKRTTTCKSCNNFNRSVASCETWIDGHMLSNISRGSSFEKPKLASKGLCSIPSARVAL